jgi:hypothetical protein
MPYLKLKESEMLTKCVKINISHVIRKISENDIPRAKGNKNNLDMFYEKVA